MVRRSALFIVRLGDAERWRGVAGGRLVAGRLISFPERGSLRGDGRIIGADERWRRQRKI